MERLNPNKVNVEYRSEITPIGPIIDRKYTLTHSDITGNLFLTIGRKYAYDQINKERDQVFATWQFNKNYIFTAYINVDGLHSNKKRATFRNEIFIKELPLALETIRYGDKKLFTAHPILDRAHIYIKFKSKYQEYNRIEYWGVFSNYN